MTLILSVATQDWVFQAADRRLTLIRPGHDATIGDEKQNKIVFFEGRLAIGFTGLAVIENKQCDEWLASVLRKCTTRSLSDALEQIRVEATRCFRRMKRDPKLLRHAFAGVGWSRLKNDNRLRPHLCWVSNFHDTKGTSFSKARSEFSIGTRVIGDDVQNASMTFGYQLWRNLRRKMHRNVREAAKRRLGPEAFIRILTETIRSAANRTSTVGKNLLVMSIPRSSVNQDGGVLWSTTESNEASFTCLTEESDALVPYSPIVVWAQGPIMRELTMTCEHIPGQKGDYWCLPACIAYVLHPMHYSSITQEDLVLKHIRRLNDLYEYDVQTASEIRAVSVKELDDDKSIEEARTLAFRKMNFVEARLDALECIDPTSSIELEHIPSCANWLATCRIELSKNNYPLISVNTVSGNESHVYLAERIEDDMIHVYDPADRIKNLIISNLKPEGELLVIRANIGQSANN